MNDAMSMGARFERWVAQMLRELGYSSVRHNQYLKAKDRDGRMLTYQIDIVYGRLSRRYVECKYRSHAKVEAGEVAQLDKTLTNLSIPLRKGVIVTNRYFTAQAAQYAYRKGFTMWDRDTLERLDYRRLNPIRSVRRWWHKPPILEERIRRMEV